MRTTATLHPLPTTHAPLANFLHIYANAPLYSLLNGAKFLILQNEWRQQTICVQCLGQIPDNDEQNFNLYVANEFLAFFECMPFFVLHFVIVPIDNTVPILESVTVLTHGEEHIKMLHKQIVCRGMRFGEQACWIADTAPFLTGLITKTTKIITIQQQQAPIQAIKTPPTPNSKKKAKHNNRLFMIPEFAEDEKPTSLQLVVCKDANLFALACRDSEILDAHSIVLASLETLKRLACTSESYLYLQKYSRFVQVVAVPDCALFADDTLFMSEYMAYQLKDLPSELSVIVAKDAPPKAHTAVIGPIKSPNLYSPDNKLDRMPKQLFLTFFKHAKIMSLGDTFYMDHQQQIEQFEDMEELMFAENDMTGKKFDTLRAHMSYFKVLALKDEKDKDLPCALVDIHSSLITRGEKNDLLPPLPRFLDDSMTHLAPFKHMYDMIAGFMSASKKSKKSKLRALSLLLHGNKGSGKTTVCKKIAEQLGLHLLEVNCYELLGENETVVEDNLRQVFHIARDCAPCMIILKRLEALAHEEASVPSHVKAAKIRVVRAIQEELQKETQNQQPLILIAATEKLDDISLMFRSGTLFIEKIAFPATLESEQRQQIVASLMKGILTTKDMSIDSIAKKLTGASYFDVRLVVDQAKAFALQRKNKQMVSHAMNVILDTNDFDKFALVQFRKAMNRATGAPQVPTVKWEDIGGLEHAKKEILETIQLPLQQPHLFSAGGLKQRSGILLYGPPGTGKTLLAKAVATECQLNFLSVKGPELINMYVGESERNIREIFAKARQAKPCVIFFDELDALAPNRGVGGDSGGVMDRIVSQLLAELDGATSSGKLELFVIGATNRPDLIDSALLRPGRFDRMVYLGTSGSATDILKILKAQTRKFVLADNVDFEALVAMILEYFGFRMTGADYYALCSDALMTAISRYTDKYKEKKQSDDTIAADDDDDADMQVVVEQADFVKAIEKATPSVSEEDMQRYKHIQKSFKQ